MTAVKTLVGWVALLFHIVLCLLALVTGALAMVSGQTLHLDILPWTGSALAKALVFGGLFGLLTIVLTIAEKLRFLFVLWTVAVAIVLTKGMVFSSFRFAPGEWKHGMYLILAAWFTVLGAWLLTRVGPAPGPRKYRVK